MRGKKICGIAIFSISVDAALIEIVSHEDREEHEDF
jgi:hypothetical protein